MMMQRQASTLCAAIVALVTIAVAEAQTPAPPPPAPTAPAATPAAAPAAPCSSPEARQFDFWVGEWIGSWKNPNGTSAQGTNRVESILGGCVIHENFEGASAQQLVGKSYSVWSPALKKWQQTWVDNSGGYLELAGQFADGKMVLLRDGLLGNGKMGKQRMTFSNISKEKFDWDWDTSDDGGATWTNRWHIVYTRK